jgi:mRNA-degrading endonuclease RelE of RelBE toxin-antitoxin system
MFDIEYSRQAVKFLKSLDKKLVLRILNKIEKLKEEPIQHDSKTVEGYNENLNSAIF